MENVSIVVQPREVNGSRAARRLRRAGYIPGILYGHGQTATPFAVEPHVMREAMGTEAGRHAILEVTIEGVPGKRQAVIKQVDLHPTRAVASHVDLQEIRLDETIETTVTVHFEGESVGVKAGGVLDETLREVTVKGRVTDIPEHLVLDITGLEIGDTGKVSDLQVPDTIVVMADADEVLCTILAPRVEEETPAETAEPELVRKEKAGE